MLGKLVGDGHTGNRAHEGQWSAEEREVSDDSMHDIYQPVPTVDSRRRHTSDSREPSRRGPNRSRHATTSRTGANILTSTRMATRPPAHAPPTNLQQLEEDEELQARVAQIITANMTARAGAGKKCFAHSFVQRGHKRTSTGLGELSLAEYNMGYIKLIRASDDNAAEIPHMFSHLEAVNEDASMYEWGGVRFWSEEVTSRVAEGKLLWSDTYDIDMLRLKFSQQNRAAQPSTETKMEGTFDALTDITPEVRTAKPAPPCRHFNAGNCNSKSHHVVNGYRYLHICASCIYHKCMYLTHPEKDCRSKEYRQKKAAKDQPLGFGK